MQQRDPVSKFDIGYEARSTVHPTSCSILKTGRPNDKWADGEYYERMLGIATVGSSPIRQIAFFSWPSTNISEVVGDHLGRVGIEKYSRWRQST